MNCRLITGFAIGLLAAGSLSAETLTWTGAESATWDATSVNWTNESGVATAWVNGSDAFFPSNAVSPVSVAGEVELRNLVLEKRGNIFVWTDGGGLLTFVSDAANPTNYVRFGSDGLHHELHVRVSCTAPFAKEGSAVLQLYNDNNRFDGGFFQTETQIRICTSGAAGTNAVIMLGNSTVFNYDAPIAPDLKFIQDGGANNLLGSVGPLLTIKSVGATENNASRVFRIGRNIYDCAVSLSLTDPESEGIGQYVFVGPQSTFSFDGGVVKAAPETGDLFFKTVNGATPAARVSNNGATFDTAGANTDLGLSLTFDEPRSVTNVVETVYPNDWSFENSSLTANWSLSKGGNTGETSSSQPTNSAFMKDVSVFVPSYFTTNGARFAVVRRSHTLSQDVALPSAGLWRVVYERGCRPQLSYSGHDLAMTVSLGGADNATVSPAQSQQYVFRREETALFPLEAGTHKLSFAVDAINKASYAALLDAVRLERCEVVDLPKGSLVKTGAGTLVVTNLVSAGLVAVSNGTLAVKGTTLDGPSFDVADGGTLALYATRLTNATVTVADGGTLSLRDDFVMNGSFEEDELEAKASRDYASGKGPLRWTFARTSGAQDNAGIQYNGSPFSNKGGAYTDCGSQTAYMRPCSQLKQTVTVPVAGEYDVSFLHGCRWGYPSYLLELTFKVDGVEVASNGTHDENYGFERSVTRLNLQAGEHTLLFAAGSAENRYASIFIDDVRLTSVAGLNALDGNEFAFASGATLDLQNSEPIYLAGGVTVDGRTVKGNEGALRRAGIVVTGSGSIQIGPPQGTMILFR